MGELSPKPGQDSESYLAGSSCKLSPANRH